MNKKIIAIVLLCLSFPIIAASKGRGCQKELSILKIQNIEGKTLLTTLLGPPLLPECTPHYLSIAHNCKLELKNGLVTLIFDNDYKIVSAEKLHDYAVCSLQSIGRSANSTDPLQRTNWLSKKIIISDKDKTRYLITEIVDESTPVQPKQAVITMAEGSSNPMIAAMKQQTPQNKLSILKLRNVEGKQLFTTLRGSSPSPGYVPSCSSIVNDCSVKLRSDAATIFDNDNKIISVEILDYPAFCSLHRIGQLANSMDHRERTKWLSETLVVSGKDGTRYIITEIVDESTHIEPKQAFIPMAEGSDKSFPAGTRIHKGAQLTWPGEIAQTYNSGKILSILYSKEGQPATKLMNKHTVVMSKIDVKALQEACDNKKPFYFCLVNHWNKMVVYQVTKFDHHEKTKDGEKSLKPLGKPQGSSTLTPQRFIAFLLLGMGIAASSYFLIYNYADKIFDIDRLNSFLNKMRGQI